MMTLKKIILMLLMIAAAALAIIVKPTHKIAEDRKGFVLEAVIPTEFNGWKVDDNQVKAIVNPQQETLINKIYNQTLSRSYVNTNGDRVMLVIAYGEDQSDGTQLHYPEVCYPSQGFQITSKTLGILHTEFGDIKVKNLIATLGQRVEPITYWTTIGDKVVVGGRQAKLEKLRYGFNGVVPDGLLVRVSSIDSNKVKAFETQENFINDLIKNINSSYIKQVTGL